MTILCLVISLNLHAQDSEFPIHLSDKPLYADLDTTNQIVYLFSEEALWTYSLVSETWNLRTEIDEVPIPIQELEFGFNHDTQKPLLWSRGIGHVYEIDTTSNSLIRIDNSFLHKNQYGHIPFFRDGKLHAFGGYGLWLHKNFISFYDRDLGEWNLHSPSKSTPFPSERSAKFGFYNHSEDALYIYGGTQSKNNRPDDNQVEKISTNDIWRYSFKDLTWEFITTLSFDGWSGYIPASHGEVSRQNKLSLTAYSPMTNVWYIPFRDQSNPNQVFHFLPLNVKTEQVFEPIEIPLSLEPAFSISHIFYNPKTASFVFLGMDNLTNQKAYPLRLKTLSEESLFKAIPIEESFISNSWLLVSFSAFIFLAFIFLYWRMNSEEDRKSEENSINVFLDDLNDNEKALFHTLDSYNGFMESHILEEQAWPDIKNYDYRRKLRNETINSINEKFEKLFGSEKPVIIRKKDSKDNRRYLYGLDQALLNN
jgi:hypothetical protein